MYTRHIETDNWNKYRRRTKSSDTSFASDSISVASMYLQNEKNKCFAELVCNKNFVRKYFHLILFHLLLNLKKNDARMSPTLQISVVKFLLQEMAIRIFLFHQRLKCCLLGISHLIYSLSYITFLYSS